MPIPHTPPPRTLQAATLALAVQCERLEADADALKARAARGTGRGAARSAAADATRVEERLRTHRWHVDRLERCLRCLENGEARWKGGVGRAGAGGGGDRKSTRLNSSH